MEIIRLKLSELTPDPNNAKEHTDDQIEQIEESIRRFGFNDPIGVWGDSNIIVEGHGRYEALKRLGFDKVECVRLDQLTDEERKAYALAHNQTTMNTGFIPEKLDLNLESIGEIDMSMFGFDGNNMHEWFSSGDKGEANEGEEEYKEFLNKFEDKHTTDDCYTPEKVYDAVKKWVANEYKLNQKDFVRPFYPGGDYQKEKYKQSSIVVDNPPFSILAQIIKWYTEHGIKFFLFAPALTVFSSAASFATILCTGCSITYANGAVVATSFVTNLESDSIRAKTAPALFGKVEKAMEETLSETKRCIPVYSYPDNVATAAMLNRYSKYGIDYVIQKGNSVVVDALDAQREAGKAIFGKGLLLSERAAAEKAAAEKAAAEKAAATKWEISPREQEIIKGLGA